MAINPLIKYKHAILYGIALAGLLFLLKWLEWRLVIFDHAFEVYIGAIAVVFTALGIWLALKLTKPKVERVIVEVEKTVYVERREEEYGTVGRPEAEGGGMNVEQRVNVEQAARLDLSKRELEVLGLMAQGFSNQEIAEKLFVSLNTIKTHTSRIFEKMDVKRRTQAIDMAKRLNII
ncbi:MAG: response regulator transcription factor [Chitinophagaceae bacterium]|nr:response regulator transcription factor [Chitinophagaceae bacterium]